jgi:hypothetical protein
MTEVEWNDGHDAQAMLSFVDRMTGRRKLRLIACACARTRWDGIVEDEFRQAVEVAERCADDLAGHADMRAAAGKIECLYWGEVPGDADANGAAHASVEDFAGDAARRAVTCVPREAPIMIREIIGNPFRNVVTDAGWRVASNGRLMAMAQAAYDKNQFDDLPRLAELLRDAGCRDNSLLVHLGSAHRHFRGCWALDAVLGKGHGKPLVSEADWLAETHPFYMLNWWRYFRGKPSSRKRRLLACASCRLVWHLFADKCLREAVECAEQFVEGKASESELHSLSARARALGLARGEPLGTMPFDAPGRQSLADSWRVAHAASASAGPEDFSFGNAMHYVAQDGGRGRDTVDVGQTALIREILGDTPYPVTLEPRWLTCNVVELANFIYDERAFDRLTLLADELEDTGCDSKEIIAHCRSKRPHVRGCWVIDLLLGKK